jgi:hypothetical protein
LALGTLLGCCFHHRNVTEFKPKRLYWAVNGYEEGAGVGSQEQLGVQVDAFNVVS